MTAAYFWIAAGGIALIPLAIAEYFFKNWWW